MQYSCSNGRLVLKEVIPWLDSWALTKLLMSGDKLLTIMLKQNVNTIFQYYHADPVFEIWQWPQLPLLLLSNITTVVLVTPLIATLPIYEQLDPTPQYTEHLPQPSRRPLYQVKLHQLPCTVRNLTLKFTTLDRVSWKGVQLPYLEMVDIEPTLLLGLPVELTSLLDATVKLELNTAVFNNMSRMSLAEKDRLTHLRIYHDQGLQHNIKQEELYLLTGLTSISFHKLNVPIDIVNLPYSLTSISATHCHLMNFNILASINKIIELNLDQTDVESNVITCPASLLKLKYHWHSNNIRVRVIVPHTIQKLEYYAEPDDEVIVQGHHIDNKNDDKLSLTSLKIKLHKLAQGKSTMDLLSRSEDLRELVLIINPVVIVMLPELLCCIKRGVERISIITPESINESLRYCPSETLIAWHCPKFCTYQVMISDLHQNLRELTISVDYNQMIGFNTQVKRLPSLEYLDLSIVLGKKNWTDMESTKISLSLPVTLTELHVRNRAPGVSPSFKFVDGIPPRLKILNLIDNNLIQGWKRQWTHDKEQVKCYPTSLEICIPAPPPAVTFRLHNLIDSSCVIL